MESGPGLDGRIYFQVGGVDHRVFLKTQKKIKEHICEIRKSLRSVRPFQSGKAERRV